MSGILLSDNDVRPGDQMIPIMTSIDDIETVLGFASRQVGWIPIEKARKSLGTKLLDDRKLGAMAYLGLIERDGNNVKITASGMLFNNGDRVDTLRQALLQSELYRSTLEWLHFGAKAEVTAVEVGQYWQEHHLEAVGPVNGDRLKDGAVFLFRIADAGKLGTMTIGRGGKETRFSAAAADIAALVDSDIEHLTTVTDGVSPLIDSDHSAPEATLTPVTPAPTLPTVSLTASPSVHVNVEIHIAADATADTVREIFRNMARYVLDKHVDD